MSVREFTDSHGVEWRVWDVTPTHIHPATRGEDFMHDLQDGWLAFDCGVEKRRLQAPYPSGWITASLSELETLCRHASPVLRRRTSSGEHLAIRADELENEAIVDARASRTFLSPRGREWTVRLHECLDVVGDHSKVLRFTAGDIIVELTAWPENWRECTVERFALMLLDAEPPRRRKAQGPQRRQGDRPSEP